VILKMNISMPSSPTPPPLPPSIPSPVPPGFIPPPPPPPPQKPELVKLVIENLDQKIGVLSKKIYRLVITDCRLIFAIQQKTGIDYLKRDPALTLAENPANFAIPLEDLIKIETYSAGMDDTAPDYMIVITSGQKMRFNIKNYYKVQKQLKDVLGSKAS
jgi:hypothetical protein